LLRNLSLRSRGGSGGFTITTGMATANAKKLIYKGTADVFKDDAAGVVFEKDGDAVEVSADVAEKLVALPGHSFETVAAPVAAKPKEGAKS